MTIVKEAHERVPAAKHIVDRLGKNVVARQRGTLGYELGVKLDHHEFAEILAHRETIGGGLPVAGAFDVEQGSSLRTASSAIDVGKLKELAPGVREATGLKHRTKLTSEKVSADDLRPRRRRGKQITPPCVGLARGHILATRHPRDGGTRCAYLQQSF